MGEGVTVLPSFAEPEAVPMADGDLKKVMVRLNACKKLQSAHLYFCALKVLFLSRQRIHLQKQIRCREGDGLLIPHLVGGIAQPVIKDA